MKTLTIYALFCFFISAYNIEIEDSEKEPIIIYNITDFRSNPLGGSIKEGLYRVALEDDDIGDFKSTNSRIVGYIDFNNDKNNDMVICTTTDQGDEIIEFHTYNYKKGRFEKSSKEIRLEKGEILNNLIALDLDNNNSLDLIVTVKVREIEKHIFFLGSVKKSELSSQNNLLDFEEDISFDRNNYEIVSKGILIADLEGNNLKCILFFDSTDNVRKYVIIENNEFKLKSFEELINKDYKNQDQVKRHNSLPLELINSSSFVDIDGDCLNDLIISSYDDKLKKRYIEIWRGKSEIINSTDNKLTFVLVKDIYEITSDFGYYSIADINRDGMLDLSFTILDTKPKALIAYNTINKVTYWDGDYCFNNDHKNNNFTKVFIDFSSKLEDNNLIDVKLDEKYPISRYDFNKNQLINLYTEDSERFYENKKYGIHPILRIGDINTDSYPDFLLTLDNKGVRSTKVFMNCQQEILEDQAKDIKNINIRNFAEDCKGSEKYVLSNTNSKEIYSSFFDLDENGQLDILVVLLDGDKFKIQGFYNNYHYDAFFLKSLNTRVSAQYRSFAIGVTYRYIATNLNGSRRLDVNYQALQFNLMSLFLPYTFIGIGRSNNYIENFHVISPTFTSKEGNNYKIFTPVIPNSQLLISENTQAINGSTIETTKAWNLDLIVNPTSMLFLIIGVIIIILVLLLLLIVYLHCQELKEDQVNDNMIFTTWFN